jgi:hypothetical protein
MTLFDAVLSPFDGFVLIFFFSYLGYSFGFKSGQDSMPTPEPNHPRRNSML